jgi:uncharacterized repeat protein (TIGR03803 family)
MSFAKITKLSLLLLIGLAVDQSLQAQTYTVLFRFSQTLAQGAHPEAGLIQDAAGNLYGTTNGGGSAKLGTVFKFSTTGQETVLHSFLGGADGAHPLAGLIFDSAGNLYGTTQAGGPANLGTVFKLDALGNEIVLHSFAGGTDGANPYGSLIRDSAGNLYGTTFFGGTAAKGTVFKVDTAGNETILHSFTGEARGDGANPAAGLVGDSAGNFYGTTKFGGLREGIVFKMDPNGGMTVLFSFPYANLAYGEQPLASLILHAGYLYGTANRGGSFQLGTVFKLDTSGGHVTALHSFDGSDGASPLASVVSDSSGNLYGTTARSPGCTCGVVFKLDPNGVETVLHTFTGGSDGRKPAAGLWMDSAGNLYGTTEFGGTGDQGTIFKITP